MKDEEDEVAVIGIGCHFPGGEGVDSFWKVLLEGRSCVVDIPEGRFDPALWFDADGDKPGKTQTTKAAFIEGFNGFDHRFFSISEAESESMDPQQKLVLQCSYRALEDAGIAMESISGSRTGVYMGLMNRDYERLRSNSSKTINHYNGTGTAMSMAANRVSFTFNLTGPSLTVDSACSSSLVAVHLACQAMRQGDCDMALCGGVSCILEPRVFVALSKAKMISPEGTSKPFSSAADGYGRGEGCGVLLLKPLHKAVKDHDRIWGLISKTAVNQDGRSVTPITKPSMAQQEELLNRVYSQADRDQVQYVEAHGTGTPVGDLTEAGSLSKAICKSRAPGSGTLRVGSVKGNIGHTESAAGVAGLIKVLLMMKHQTLVPTVHYSQETSGVDAKSLNMQVVEEAERWEAEGGRMAGVNSFGFGGTNAHAIVREHRQAPPPSGSSGRSPNLFVVSASSERSLSLTVADTQQRLSRGPTVDLRALSYTAACGRSHRGHRYRKAFIASSPSELERQLTSALNTKVGATPSDVRVVFVFCGNGVSYRGMCQQLFRESAVFRDKVREVQDLFQTHKDIRIIPWLSADAADDDDDGFSQPGVVQPLLFAVQLGISALLKHWGIKPDAVLGHSVGEVAAAHCAGLLSLEDAVKVLFHRSALQTAVRGGKMLVVCNVAVEKVLASLPDDVSVAALNSPRSCTLSGDPAAVDLLHQRLESGFADEAVFLHELDVPAAYHSRHMDPVLEELQSRVGRLAAQDEECRLYSTVTGLRRSDGDFLTGSYWARNLREPVLFEQTLHAVHRDQPSRSRVVFVEIGPRGALHRNILETLGNDTIVLPSAQPQRDRHALLSTAGRLFELGLDVDLGEVYRGCETSPTEFPVYQFDNTRPELSFEAMGRTDASCDFSHHPLVSQRNRSRTEFTCDLSSETAPYLWEHQSHGVPILPGAVYVELAYAAVMESLRPKKAVSLLQLSVSFEKVFPLSSVRPQLTVELDQNQGSFIIRSSGASHASGTYRCTDRPPLLEEPSISLGTVSQRCGLVLTPAEVYGALSEAGFEYGPVFRRLQEVRLGDQFREVLSEVKVPSELLKDLHEFFLHPVLLDSFLQMSAVAAAVGRSRTKRGFPSAIGSVVVSGPLQETMVMYSRATQVSQDHLEVCGSFCTPEGTVLVELKGVRISFLGQGSDIRSWFFHSETVAVPLETDSQGPRMRVVVFEDDRGLSEGLRPLVHPGSVFVGRRQRWTPDQVRGLVSHSLRTDPGLEGVLFVWGVEDLSPLSPERILDSLVTCCETLRQIVLALKDLGRPGCVRVITYRSTERHVDQVSAGFVLPGLVRAYAAEIPGLSFQLIDLSSLTGEDLQTLVQVMKTSRHQEVVICGGKASTSRIQRSPETDRDLRSQDPDHQNFTVWTSDPYRVTRLSAVPSDPEVTPIPEGSVGIRISCVCVHSADYFPVSASHLDHGRTLYWDQRTTQDHRLLALDFRGTVSAVGKGVHHLRVGDPVVSCYPVPASAQVTVPAAVCFSTHTLPFLKHTPCVSFFVLAWEILQRVLSKVKPPRRLVLISSNPGSALMKVLALTANRSSWSVSSSTHFRPGFSQSPALVFLPPFDGSWQQIPAAGGPGRCVIFVCSDSTWSPLSVNRMKSEHTQVHKLSLTDVLQRTGLQERSRTVSDWLTALGFGPGSLPLRKETFQSSDESHSDPESYFTSNTVKQVFLTGSDPPESGTPLLMRPGPLFRRSSAYVVSGGLSGLGLETVKFIAGHGGGCIVTLSRRTLSEELKVQMDLLHRRHGTRILNIQCDVSESVQVQDAVSQIEQRFPSFPIRGVFHSAAVLHDGMIETLDQTLFRKVLKPKVGGALNLHHATLHRTLDFFVCYSSISSFIGNTSQSNYAAANSFLDTFCHYRRNRGLPAQSINWGPLNLGLLLNKDHFHRFLEAKGMRTMGVSDVSTALKKCLLMNRAQQVICKFHFRNLSVHVLSQNASLRERLSALVQAELREDVSHGSTAQSLSLARERVRSIVSEISRVGVDELDEESTLGALGIDSMLAMTLQNQVFQETGVNVPLVRILDPKSTLGTLETMVVNEK
ncbi:mycocerosic acid synthase [Halichoeres trimaculatus]|uniref:mycocerosic acid synthase n=1 Tax=Halichoeres trimaculatus TaxID=147232 RepID=UPI003D9F755B